MHKLVNEIHSRSGGDQEPTDICGDEPSRYQGRGDGHQSKNYQGVWGEKSNPPVTGVGEPHVFFGKELVVVKGVASINCAEKGIFTRPVHDMAMEKPFKKITT